MRRRRGPLVFRTATPYDAVPLPRGAPRVRVHPLAAGGAWRARFRRARHPLAPAGRPRPLPPRSDPRPVVLVVDDEPGVRASVKMVLDGVCEVVEASDGPAAIESVRSGDVDVCLLDVRLPGNGRDRGAGADQAPRRRLGGGARHRRPHRPDGGGGDEARRLRLPDQAVRGGRPAERGQPGSGAPRAPAGGPVSPGRARAARGVRSAGRPISLDAPRLRASCVRSPTPRPQCSSPGSPAPARS